MTDRQERSLAIAEKRALAEKAKAIRVAAITRLVRAGLNDNAVASEVGCGPEAVANVRRDLGREPNWSARRGL